MRKRLFLVATVLTVLVVTAFNALSQVSPNPIAGMPETPELGIAFDPALIPPEITTVWPDGRGLPSGSGTAIEGAAIYADACSGCHGATGVEGPMARLVGSDGLFDISDPWRPIRVMDHPILMLSAGAMWPEATTLFDYIRRAMPYGAPKTLSNDEIYAVTAWILAQNGLVEKDARIDATTLPAVRMPGHDRIVFGWPDNVTGNPERQVPDHGHRVMP